MRLVLKRVRHPVAPDHHQRHHRPVHATRRQLRSELLGLACRLPREAVTEPALRGGPLGLDGVDPTRSDRDVIDVAPLDRHVVEDLPALRIQLAQLLRGPPLRIGAPLPRGDAGDDLELQHEQRYRRDTDADQESRHEPVNPHPPGEGGHADNDAKQPAHRLDEQLAESARLLPPFVAHELPGLAPRTTPVLPLPRRSRTWSPSLNIDVHCSIGTGTTPLQLSLRILSWSR